MKAPTPISNETSDKKTPTQDIKTLITDYKQETPIKPVINLSLLMKAPTTPISNHTPDNKSSTNLLPSLGGGAKDGKPKGLDLMKQLF